MIISRRFLLQFGVVAALPLPLRAMQPDPWSAADAIVASLASPVNIPVRDFPLTPVSDDARSAQLGDVRPALLAAIAACHAAGGGRVVVPSGDWSCAGPIRLLSNVNLHLSKNCRIRFSADPADYAKDGEFDCGPNGKLVRSRWQGNDCLNFSPPIYAIGQSNIALTGEDWTSVLDGQGHSWWRWKSHDNPDPAALPAMSEAGRPVERRIFGLGHKLIPCMVEFIECENVLLQGYQTTNTPFWQHHPVACKRLVIRDVFANSMGPNNDGFDPESCTDVLCERVTFNTGDDCIAIKAGKNKDTQYGPAENHVIQNCVMNSGHGGVTLGSEQAAGIRNIYARDLVMKNENWASSPLNIAIRVKANMNRGAVVENFYVKNVELPNGVALTPHFYQPIKGGDLSGQRISSNQGGVFTIDCDYQPDKDQVRTRPPVVRNISISGVKVSPPPGAKESCYQAFILLGPVASDYNGDQPAEILPVENVTISDCDFGTPANSREPYFTHNVRNLTLRDVRIAGRTLTAALE
jgi:polygalacturonase